MTFPCETPRSGAASLFAIALQGHLPTLATDRLIMRAPRVTDFDTYAQIACTDRGQHLGGPMSREDAWLDFSQMTSTWLLHGHGLWTIGHAGDIAGFVVLGYEPGDQEPELGFMLTERAEGMGIAQEAAQAALTHAFDTLGWSTLVSYIDPANARSIKLAQRLGGLPDGEIAQDGETTLIYRYVREVM
ncbi:GNAT family N-acetyltransferase [Tateyamaria omphalii]|uniref:GNAT family N-acetyltransferase n=1 Tax=Tateyamaria omphalii TaxID=299262 RepID=UPI001C9A02AD|nr:GNAT family N-acetyltransferase [Tateyamaria omphalii]MBY5934564.1 GNAT family N-acetyltransferase [Tateyamaria omphalii]